MSSPWRAGGVNVYRALNPDDPTDFSGEAIAWTVNEAAAVVIADALNATERLREAEADLRREMSSLLEHLASEPVHAHEWRRSRTPSPRPIRWCPCGETEFAPDLDALGEKP